MRCLLLACFVVACSATCTSAEDCSLNGICSAGSCVCDVPWKGHQCTLLDVTPPTVKGIYGYAGGPYSTTSWGGNVVEHGGQYHLYVSDIGGKRCGLHAWGSHSRIIHATAANITGPYTKVDIAVPHYAHNPQVLRFNTSFYIFHIGTGSATHPLSDCGENDTLTSDDMRRSGGSTGGVIHVATSPEGPWTPLTPEGYEHCNNPSPFMHPNGTLFVMCTWSLRRASRPEGPWSTPLAIHIDSAGKDRHWEDPFGWVDRRGNFHLLSHTWASAPYPTFTLSGHAYSKDGLNWTFSPVEPYQHVVKFDDGTTHSYATMERPKLLFAGAAAHTPTHLLNGVSPHWGPGPNPCSQCHANGRCSACKVTAVENGDAVNLDWTYTLMQPLALD